VLRPSMAERVGFLISRQSEVGWVISPTGQPAGNQTRKNRTLCEERLGFGTAKAVVASGAVTVHVPRR